jgi:hypothetical protein
MKKVYEELIPVNGNEPLPTGAPNTYIKIKAFVGIDEDSELPAIINIYVFDQNLRTEMRTKREDSWYLKTESDYRYSDARVIREAIRMADAKHRELTRGNTQ